VPRYFFNVHDGKDIENEDGTVLSGDAQAREQAVTTAAEIIRSDAAALPRSEPWEMVLTDGPGRLLPTLHFSAEVSSSCAALNEGSRGPGRLERAVRGVSISCGLPAGIFRALSCGEGDPHSA
jgi:hypothetical protein